jgi:hypothetical protein
MMPSVSERRSPEGGVGAKHEVLARECALSSHLTRLILTRDHRADADKLPSAHGRTHYGGDGVGTMCPAQEISLSPCSPGLFWTRDHRADRIYFTLGPEAPNSRGDLEHNIAFA